MLIIYLLPLLISLIIVIETIEKDYNYSTHF
jgi:hypothetical protein